MLAGGESADALARDTVFAAVMIVCNGVVGLCLLLGGAASSRAGVPRRGHEPGAGRRWRRWPALALVLPSFTTDHGRADVLSGSQLAFAGVCLAGALWRVSSSCRRCATATTSCRWTATARTCTRRRRRTASALDQLRAADAQPGCRGRAGQAAGAGAESSAGVDAAGAPVAVVGIAIALLVLLPETWAAVRAARRNRMQTSLNLALGSVLATIGLTIPTVGAVADRHWHSARAGPACQGDRFAGADPAGLRDHAGGRPRHHHAGRGAPRAVRGLPVSRHRARERAFLMQNK